MELQMKRERFGKETLSECEMKRQSGLFISGAVL